MNTETYINGLLAYGLEKELFAPADKTYVRNRLLEILGLDDFDEEKAEKTEGLSLPQILAGLTDFALKTGIISDGGSVTRDLFDTKLMGALTDRPSAVAAKFRGLYAADPKSATDWFYGFSRATNYIRADRVARDRKWKTASVYGDIDITINLSKPEKDPKAIAAARTMKQSGYPKCLLCMENEGYAGRINHPARQNHRIIPITVAGENWGFQYSPYVYYNEHCIVFNGRHTPMKIERRTFEKLFSFVEQFPHYFLGSNADLPIVGGSILTHDHFQGGHYTFAMEKAELEKEIRIPGYEDVQAGIVKWPLSVIRIRCADKSRLTDLADHILSVWRGYTDEAAFVYACTDGEPHNTITPIARMRDGLYELDLTLRNNITTAECPMGLYHPHEEYHNIKKENIGLIEVMGLAVLPARLDAELSMLEKCLLGEDDIDAHEELAKHKTWAESIKRSHPELAKDNVRGILEEETGRVFVRVLEDAGVYKCTAEGREAFDRFIQAL